MNHQEHHAIQFIIGIPLFFVLLSAYFTVGYMLAGLLFRVTGTPSALASSVVSGVLGFLLFAVGALTISAVRTRRHRKRYGNPDRHRVPFGQELMRALEQISRGDFNVLLSVDERDPLRKLSESVNKMARELGSMEKLRQDFISDVSHELQSPLTSIAGFAALLQKDGVSGEDVSHYAAIIETESRRLSKLSDNLLRLSTLEAGVTPLETREFRLDKQLENILLMLEPQWAGKNLSPEASLAKLSVSGNEALLSQVWINLLHNAIKFTPEGGTIHVQLTMDNGQWTVTVADSGIGIPEEAQIHIFERFYKADKSRDRALGGNGLGLSLVKKIVELHGGRVAVVSAKGKGAAFTVTIPAEK